MSGTGAKREVEIKLRVEDAALGRHLLRRVGFRVVERRILEVNILYDTPRLDLRRRGALLRVRQTGRRFTVTFKSRSLPGKHKTREEVEIAVPDGKIFGDILRRLGFGPVFRYEKYRTVHRAPRGDGVATLDETPIGVFLELEGAPGWIDRTAKRLGFSEKHYITKSYGQLYRDACRRTGVAPSHMVFHGRQKGIVLDGQTP